MQMTELGRPTMEDKKHLEEQIKDLTNSIESLNKDLLKTNNFEEKQGIDIQIMRRTKELRRLRRLRK